MTQKSRYFLIVSGVVMILALAGGLIAYLTRAGGLAAGLPEELRYVPADAVLVGYADVRAVMDSELRRELMSTIQPGPRKGRQTMHEFAGIDLEKQVSHVVGYVAASAATAAQPGSGPVATEEPQMPRGVMLVQGTFEQPRIEQFIRDHGGTIEEHNGRHFSVRRKGTEQIGIGFIRTDLIAVGEAGLVRRALDQADGSQRGSGQNLITNAEIMEVVRDASGSTAWAVGHFDAVTRAVKLPNEVSTRVPPMRIISAKADVNGGVKATIRADSADPAAAEQLREVVRGFIALARMQGGGRPELEGTLKSIQLSGTGKTVQLTFAISPAVVRTLAPRPPEITPDAAPRP
jgi:hypothetical protein